MERLWSHTEVGSPGEWDTESALPSVAVNTGPQPGPGLGQRNFHMITHSDYPGLGTGRWGMW